MLGAMPCRSKPSRCVRTAGAADSGLTGPSLATGLSGMRHGGRESTDTSCRQLKGPALGNQPLALVPVAVDCRGGPGAGYGLSSCTTSEVFAESGASARRSIASHITR